MSAKVKRSLLARRAASPISPEREQRHAEEAISLLKAMASRNRLLLQRELVAVQVALRRVEPHNSAAASCRVQISSGG